MNWYHLQRGYETDSPFYVSREGDLDGHEWWDFDRGTPITNWQSRSWIKSLSAQEDGPADDGLVNHFALLIFSSRMQQSLQTAGIQGIQYLPIRVLKSDGAEYPGYSIANILNVPSALDRTLSDFSVYPEDYFSIDQRGQVSGIRKAVLKKSALGDFHVIRLREFPEQVCVSERFVDLYDRNHFTGYSFQQLQLDGETAANVERHKIP